MADRYNNINNTSPYESALKNSQKQIPKSDFDYTKAHYGNLNIGTIEILDCFETLPKGTYTLSMDLLLKVRVAMRKRIMTGQRVYVHAWYMSLNDLWEGAQNHIDHGRSGLLDIEKPYTTGIFYAANSSNEYLQLDYFTPNSVFNQLGVPSRRVDDTIFNQNSYLSYLPSGIGNQHGQKLLQNYTTKVNALPAVMYQRIYLDKYAPKNLLQDNKNAYPDNAEKIRIAYNITELNSINRNGGHTNNQADLSNYQLNDYLRLNNISAISTYDANNSFSLLTTDTVNDQTYMPPVGIGIKRYRQKKGDYFTTSSPFADLLRGDAPTIDLAGFSANVDFSNVINDVQVTPLTNTFNAILNATNIAGASINLTSNHTDRNNVKTDLLEALNKAKVNGNIQTATTANMLRTLIALTLIKERNALTNGDYNEMVKAQFGYSPNVDDYGPKYIGGFYQDIVFSDVTQTSESSNSSPLGNQSGQAMSANSGYIGKFTAPDYGYIMILASIVPDNIYAQGLPRYLSDLSSDDVYTSPLLNNLPPQAIKNKEIYLSTNEAFNEDVFSYTQRFEHLRHRENQASGLVALKNDAAEDSSYIQYKPFSSTPQFNAKFVSLCPDNVDMSIYDVINEPPYIFNAISRVDKIEPLPYDSLPADFGFKF